MDKSGKRKLVAVLEGKSFEVPPVWLMRQAGRYLPEYREVRAKAGGFLNLCYNSEFAVEVTLQPIRRFGFDAAILFSDILVIPDALGRSVAFKEGEGPVLDPLRVEDINELSVDRIGSHLDPVFQTVRELRRVLPEETSLIGFCGAPWTVATYMIAGGGTSDQAPARLFAHSQEDAMHRLMDTLVEASVNYLSLQLEHGADVLQVFDSWAGVLSDTEFEKWCVDPVRRIVKGVRGRHPDAKFIGFPKGAGSRYDRYRDKTKVNGLGLDWTVPVKQAISLQKEGAVQGYLDPMRLVAGGSALDDGVEEILANLGDGPLIFNLGHGITPQTPIAHVEQLLEKVRG